jgi:hypothetical protein
MPQVKLRSTFYTLFSASAALVTIAIAPIAASAASVSYDGNLSPGAPIWEEPVNGSTSPYDVREFTVDTTGLYSFTTDISPSNDPLLFLYEGGFAPDTSTRLEFTVAGSPNISATLTAGLNYFLVTSEVGSFPNTVQSSSFASIAPGSPSVAFVVARNFTNTIDGVGNITLNSGSTAVPEPFTILGTLIGGGAALRLRRKLSQANDRN